MKFKGLGRFIILFSFSYVALDVLNLVFQSTNKKGRGSTACRENKGPKHPVFEFAPTKYSLSIYIKLRTIYPHTRLAPPLTIIKTKYTENGGNRQ
jgi:hypothetical protein